MKKYRLENLKHVRRLYQKIINDLLNDEIPESRAKTVTYVLNGYANCFKLAETTVESPDLAEICKKLDYINSQN